jgi:hypothetical protein
MGAATPTKGEVEEEVQAQLASILPTLEVKVEQA